MKQHTTPTREKEQPAHNSRLAQAGERRFEKLSGAEAQVWWEKVNLAKENPRLR